MCKTIDHLVDAVWKRAITVALKDTSYIRLTASMQKMQPSKLALAIAAAAAAAVTTAASPCNGAAALCTRAYSNITFIGAHDSAFAGPLPSDNQLIPVDEQLARGVRFLQAQTHDVNDGGAIEMCHTDCLLLDAGPLSAYLAPVAAFLAANPNEVVSLLLTNGDAIPVARFADVFEAVGLVQYVFTPPGGGGLALEQWPTLQEMIDAGTRLVVWMGNVDRPLSLRCVDGRAF